MGINATLVKRIDSFTLDTLDSFTITLLTHYKKQTKDSLT